MERLIEVDDNEAARLNALRDLRILDTPPSEAFDRLTRLASRLMSAPVSTISLTDRDRQWFKSKVGVDLVEIPREQAPCSYAIQGGGVFVVSDLLADARFVDSPLAQAGIRFYAGAPLFTRSGHGLGTLCVVDDKPRALTDEEERVLRDLAGMVMSQIELQNMIGRVDPTTGYPNQHQLLEDLHDRSQGCAEAVAVLIELSPPHQVAEMARVLGSEHLDILARRSLDALRGGLGNSSRLYQVGAMRCVALAERDSENTDTVQEAEDRILDRLAAALAEPIVCAGVPSRLDPAFGVYAYAAGDTAPADVLRRLLVAAGEARREPSRRARYDAQIEALGARRFALLNDFPAAMEAEDQLALVYQPRIDLRTGRRVGVEALLRWTHPGFGAVSPGEFIPLVEQTAMVRQMTDWVARSALRQRREWLAAGVDLDVAINVSAVNMEEPDFASRLLRIVDEEGVDPRSVEVEFTESAIAHDVQRVVEQLAALRARGVSIAIDDFGTGYSNLSYIQRLPISVLKIDQSFIRNMCGSPRDQKLVQTMITMAHDLGYRVVAEGVETQEAYEMLCGWNCDEAQGYLMARPLSPRQIVATHDAQRAA
ncbi:MAG: EAL domain-containing protein [Microvirga sp.]|nr:EAL domain-containing protein [Microvirga sp.]